VHGAKTKVIKITSEYLEIKKADSEGCTEGRDLPGVRLLPAYFANKA